MLDWLRAPRSAALAMSRVNVRLYVLDAGYKSGSCSDDSSVDGIEVGDTEPAPRRSSSSVVADIEVEVTEVTPAPTPPAGAAGAAGAAAAKARQSTIASGIYCCIAYCGQTPYIWYDQPRKPNTRTAARPRLGARKSKAVQVKQ